ncbi:jg16975 [Pararge aegeria aegeria]|uniref:Jg16975 protein n=1 Tax=Pararge aegeria aegeria TaxID=348720 RepID=A0A8S4RHK0_9NEOP|nr:jg16975 [Pararge aegeria aegeria]
MPLLRSYVAYVCAGGRQAPRDGRDAQHDSRKPPLVTHRAEPGDDASIARRERMPKSIRYTVDYILFNKLEVFINNQ